MATKPLSRIPKNRKPKMKQTEGEMALQFIEENGHTLSFIMWQELILEPQVISGDVSVEAIDVDYITMNDPGDENNGTSGKSTLNYGVIEQSSEDPTRV